MQDAAVRIQDHVIGAVQECRDGTDQHAVNAAQLSSAAQEQDGTDGDRQIDAGFQHGAPLRLPEMLGEGDCIHRGVSPVDQELYRNEQVGEVVVHIPDVGNIGGVEPQEGGNEQPCHGEQPERQGHVEYLVHIQQLYEAGKVGVVGLPQDEVGVAEIADQCCDHTGQHGVHGVHADRSQPAEPGQDQRIGVVEYQRGDFMNGHVPALGYGGIVRLCLGVQPAVVAVHIQAHKADLQQVDGAVHGLQLDHSEAQMQEKNLGETGDDKRDRAEVGQNVFLAVRQQK